MALWGRCPNTTNCHWFTKNGEIDDKEDNFSFVIDAKLVKLLISIGLQKYYKFRHLDFVIAFQNVQLSRHVYVELSKYIYRNEERTTSAMKLNHALYSLKGASEAWYKLLRATFKKADLREIKSAPCV